MNPDSKADDEEMRREYDFSRGARGKYYEPYTRSSNVVVLDADVAAAFPNAAVVNEALRGLLRIARRAQIAELDNDKSD
jgi:hypothetical protein